MGASQRFYVFAEDGSLLRIPQRIAEALPRGQDSIPEFAGTTQRFTYVALDLEQGKPVRIHHSRGELWTFDEEGRADAHLERAALDRMEVLGAVAERRRDKQGSLVDLTPELRRRQIDARDRWTLSPEDLQRVIDDIWPPKGRKSEAKTVTGKAPKKQMLTHEGRWALEKIEAEVASIADRLSSLNEQALRGVAAEALARGANGTPLMAGRRRRGEARPGDPRRLSDRPREWIAVIDVMRDRLDDPAVRETVRTEHVRCASRDEAVAAARRLMAEKAEWLGEDTSVEVSICSALEWRDLAED